jgi:hypothetical protein
MNTCKALLFILLAWSTTQLTPQYGYIDYESDPEMFSDQEFGITIPDFNLLFNEEIVTLFAENNKEEYLSLDDFITPSEEDQEISTFMDLISHEGIDIDALFQENGFFQSAFSQVNELFDNFNEELASLLAFSDLNENAQNAQNTEEIVVLPNALSGIAFAMVDGLNGLEGEEERGEENLEARYNLSLAEDSRFNLAHESKSIDIYLGAFCLFVAAFVIAAIAKGLSMLRKYETEPEIVSEEDTSSNYVEIADEGAI